MRLLIEPILASGDLSLDPIELEQLVRAYRWNEYRRYGVVSGANARKVLLGVLNEAMAAPETWGWVARTDGKRIALALLEPLPWDTQHFQLSMARLTLISQMEESEHNRDLIGLLIIQARTKAQELGFDHLSVRVDVQNSCAFQALQQHGFRVMNTLCTFLFEAGYERTPSAGAQNHFRIRDYHPDDMDAVLNIATCAFTSYPSCFHIDPSIDNDAALSLYVEWAKKCCLGDMADAMLVAERANHVVGFIGWRRNAALERFTGIRIVGGGLGACHPVRANAYLELLREATARAIETASACDFETHLTNTATINFYQLLGFKQVRAAYNCHATLQW